MRYVIYLLIGFIFAVATDLVARIMGTKIGFLGFMRVVVFWPMGVVNTIQWCMEH